MQVTRSEGEGVATPASFAGTPGQWFGDFEELAMPLFDSLFNFARWLAHNQHDAEDLVQETYRKALRSFSLFKPGTNFRAWMFRILKNTFLDSRSSPEHRLTVLWPEEDGPELAVENETPETIFLAGSDRQLMLTAIEELPAHFRAPLLLCEVEEMSYQEISTALSIPIGTVMSRLARARKAIRASLRSRVSQQPSRLAATSRSPSRGAGGHG
jgi:RNA polymerase sigma-70 factor, ECF subfamily